MKLKIKNFNTSEFRTRLSHLENIDFSVFLDDIPKTKEDLSEINILVLQEPNEYFSLHDWAISNNKLFSFILTWSDKVLNNCDNAIFLPFGHTWFKLDQYEKKRNKTFHLAHLRGSLLKTYGHSLRYELTDRHNEIHIPKKFYTTHRDRYNIDEARIGKEEVFGDPMFGVAIENTSHNGYFTEKILDCFLMKTIPIYWGCSSISKFFNPEGIITFSNIDDLIYKVNNLDENYYTSRLNIINENYENSLKFIDYEKNIIDKIEEIFKHNNLL